MLSVYARGFLPKEFIANPEMVKKHLAAKRGESHSGAVVYGKKSCIGETELHEQ